MCEAQNWRCPDCGKVMDMAAANAADRPTIEHVFPLSVGGTDDEANVVVLCHSCNQRENVAMTELSPVQRITRAAQRIGAAGDEIDALRVLVDMQSEELLGLRSRCSSLVQNGNRLRMKLRELNKLMNERNKELKALRRSATPESREKRPAALHVPEADTHRRVVASGQEIRAGAAPRPASIMLRRWLSKLFGRTVKPI